MGSGFSVLVWGTRGVSHLIQQTLFDELGDRNKRTTAAAGSGLDSLENVFTGRGTLLVNSQIDNLIGPIVLIRLSRKQKDF